jgi:signal transduction histidine kinase
MKTLAGFTVAVVSLAATIGAAANSQTADPRLREIEQAAASPENGQDNLAISARAEALSVELAKQGENEPAARALRYAGVLAMMAEQHARAVPLFERSAALCRAARDPACLGRSLNNQAVALQSKGGLIASLAKLQQAAAAFNAAGEAELAATTRFNAANVQLSLGDSRGALAAYRAVARDYPLSTFELGLKTNTAAALLDLGRIDEAERTAHAALTLAQSAAAREGYLADMRIVNLGTLAEAAARKPDRGAALARLREAQALAQNGDERDRFNAALACLEVYGRLGITAAERPCADTVERLRELEDEGTRARALHLAASAFAELGEYRRALALERLAYEAVEDQRRSELTEAAAATLASVGIAERDALVGNIQGLRDAERAAADRLRLLGAGLFGASTVAVLVLITWLLRRQRRRRDEAVSAERTRVARDLHDTALQGFTALTMQLQAAARRSSPESGSVSAEFLSNLARDAGASLAQVRTAVWKMRSPESASGNLKVAIADWIDARRDDATVIELDLDGFPVSIDQPHIEALLRVIQEAVTNAVNHGEARHIKVSGHVDESKLVVEVVDDGKGFMPTEAAALGGHWGLLGMRERIEALAGCLSVESAPGVGTKIRAVVPI